MTTETSVRTENQTARASAVPAISPLAHVTEEVRRDSQFEADRYLEETVVPHGGE
jgi:hypothetical protein